MKTNPNPERFVRNEQGQLIDTQMHPKVKKAQEEYHKKTQQARARETKQK